MIVPKPWFNYPRPNSQARLRLFCFPYAGAGASIFRTWPEQLPTDIEVCTVQLSGRENRLREPLFTEIQPLIQILAQVLLPHLDLSFAFFGHSLGALIGFELARQLRRQNQPIPLHFFVSSRPAPQIPNPNLPIHQLPDTAFVEALHDYNGTPEAVLQDPELRSLFLPILQADFGMLETYAYTPEAPLNCSITAFGGLQDKKVSRDDLAGWHEQTSSTFTLRMFPGDHFFLNKEQGTLLPAISQDLSQITADDGT